MALEYTDRFVRQFVRLPAGIQSKVKKALILLDNNYRHPGLKSHPVQGAPGIFEAYVDIKYRMTFESRGDTIILRNVDNHDECLKNP